MSQRQKSQSCWCSHRANTDQVVQWKKAGVVKVIRKKKIHFARRNKVSLCGLWAQAVSSLQMSAALWGFLCVHANVKDDSQPPSLMFIKVEEKSRKNHPSRCLLSNALFSWFSQYNAGWLHDLTWAGVRQSAGLCLQDRVHQFTGPKVWGKNSEKATTQV